MSTENPGRALTVPRQRPSAATASVEHPLQDPAIISATSIAGTLIALSALRGVHVVAINPIPSDIDPQVWSLPLGRRVPAVLGMRPAVSAQVGEETPHASALHLRLSDHSTYLVTTLGAQRHLADLIGERLLSVRERPDGALLLRTTSAQMRVLSALQLTTSRPPSP